MIRRDHFLLTKYQISAFSEYEMIVSIGVFYYACVNRLSDFALVEVFVPMDV